MHKLEKKVILIDVDGTLVDYENHLPPSAVKAIRMARAQGHLVYICTGRSLSLIHIYRFFNMDKKWCGKT